MNEFGLVNDREPEVNMVDFSLHISHIFFRLEEPDIRNKTVMDDSCAIHGWLGRCIAPLGIIRGRHDYLQVVAIRRKNLPTVDVKITLCGILHTLRKEIYHQVKQSPPQTYNGVTVIVRGLELRETNAMELLQNELNGPFNYISLNMHTPTMTKKGGIEKTIIDIPGLYSGLLPRIAPNSKGSLDSICKGQRVKDIISRVEFSLLDHNQKWVSHRHFRQTGGSHKRPILMEGKIGMQKWKIEGGDDDILILARLSKLFDLVQIGRRSSYGMGLVKLEFE